MIFAGFTALSGVFPVAVTVVGKYIIDSVVRAGDRGFVAGIDQYTATQWLVLEAILVVALMVTDRLSMGMRILVSCRFARGISTRIAEKANSLHLAQLENPKYHDMLARARSEAASRPIAFFDRLMLVIRNIIAAGGGIAITATFSPWMSAVLFVAGLPMAVAEVTFQNRLFEYRMNRAEQKRRIRYIEQVMTSDIHAKEIKIFGLFEPLANRLEAFAKKVDAGEIGLTAARQAWAGGLSIVGTAVYYGCCAIIVRSAIVGEITIGSMAALMVALRQLQGAISSGLSVIGGIHEDCLYMENLFKFIEIPVVNVKTKKKSVSGNGIVFDNVSFRYDGAERCAVKDVSFAIARGERVAIIGGNGAGKSTIMKLALGLYEPTSGSVFLGGKGVTDYDKNELREAVAVMFQDFSRYQLTLRDNVALGNRKMHMNDNEILAALSECGVSLAELKSESGIETQLGRWFDGGTELSGGQWQKVAMARALLNRNAMFYLLDEPTAALDDGAIDRFCGVVSRLPRSAASMIVTHNRRTMLACDRCIALDGGAIVNADFASLDDANSARFSGSLD